MILIWFMCIATLCLPCEAWGSNENLQWRKIWYSVRDFLLSWRTCRTPECGEAAQTIIDNRNASVHPCEDFYEFTCGGWKSANPVPENDTKFDQFRKAGTRIQERVRDILEKNDEDGDNESIKKARQFYRTCLNSDQHADENMRVLLDRLAVWGGWPIATENWDQSKFDWQKLMVDVIKTCDLYPLLTIYPSIDRRNSSKTTVVLDQAIIRFCNDHLMRDSLEKETKWIRSMATDIAKATNQTLNESQLAKDIQDVILLEAKLCQMTKSIIERQDEFKMYNPKTLKELQIFTDSKSERKLQTTVDWIALIREFVSGSDVEVDENFRVVVREPDGISKMITVLEDVSPRMIANYLLWHKVVYLHDEISEEFRNMGYTYTEETTGVSGFVPRWKSCAEIVNGNLAHAIGYEYVKLYFDENEKKKAKELVTHILESFIEDLKKTDWMDATTRSSAVEKAESMVLAVGYPDWYNKTNMDKYYKEYIVGDSHVVNLENLKLFDHNRSCRTLNKLMDHTELFDSIADVNAYYLPGANMICIPAGIFQAPFYFKGRPEAMNYGGIGVVVGHEISHAFDVRGRLADKFGNLAQWWDERTLNTYQVKQKCVEKQYAEYPILPIANDHFTVNNLDGKGTVSENIADNGGVQQAFKAYKRYIEVYGSESRLPKLKNYSPEQLFFIGFATVYCESSTTESLIEDIRGDVHSPSKYRVLIPLSNSEDFADAWKCDSSYSKLTRKCTFW